MPKLARIYDQWVGDCDCCHANGGIIITASPDTYTNNRKVARIFDITICWNGHTGFICTGSPDTYTNNRKNARMFDLTASCTVGFICTGSPDVYIN